MKSRCLNPKDTNYKNYGARGIKVCNKWHNSFETFLVDMGERLKGLTLERKNNDGSYEPGNCRWATRQEQGQNSRQTKLSKLDVITIRALLLDGYAKDFIRNLFNISQPHMSRIITRKRWVNI